MFVTLFGPQSKVEKKFEHYAVPYDLLQNHKTFKVHKYLDLENCIQNDL